MKARVIDKEVNAAWIQYNYGFYAGGTNKSTDKVWLLTATEIGAKTVAPTIDTAYGTTVSTLLTGDGDPYDYFLDDVNKRKSTSNSGLVRGTYGYMWLATGYWESTSSRAAVICVDTAGSFGSFYASSSRGIVPAIRIA